MNEHSNTQSSSRTLAKVSAETAEAVRSVASTAGVSTDVVVEEALRKAFGMTVEDENVSQTIQHFTTNNYRGGRINIRGDNNSKWFHFLNGNRVFFSLSNEDGEFSATKAAVFFVAMMALLFAIDHFGLNVIGPKLLEFLSKFR